VRGRLARYALWQFRDYVFERGIPTLIVLVLMFFPLVAALRAAEGSLFDGEPVAAAALAAFIGLLPTLGFVTILLGVNGIISHDRKRGYYRFLFAKPVSPIRYYAQAFVVNWVGLLCVMGVLLLAFAALVRPVSPTGLLAFISVWYLSLGGYMVLMSAITRFDWVLTAATWGLAQVLRAVYTPDASWLGRALDILLPPFHRMGETGMAFMRGTGVPATTLLWIAGYGVAALVIGLLVLRRRPLAS
jgi:hypothetical protein